MHTIKFIYYKEDDMWIGKHDWHHNPATKMSQPIPRHREIKESLTKHIIKKLKD